MSDIHAIILTLNEAQHIERCIRSIAHDCASITVVDSGSKDDTVKIAESLGATIVANKWKNYATQMNFAIDLLRGRGGWLLRIDADEVLDEQSNLKAIIESVPAETSGILLRRRIFFLGKRIRYGAIEPSFQLRLWREGDGKCEQRWMDEHIVVTGGVKKSQVSISDINLNSIGWWIAKHNSYASREAIDLLNEQHSFLPHEPRETKQTSAQAKLRRAIKRHLYRRLPKGARAATYFIYRYIFRLGILDGRRGFFFHVLQGFWYRNLVDAKIYEIEQFAKLQRVSMVDAIIDRTGIDPLN